MFILNLNRGTVLFKCNHLSAVYTSMSGCSLNVNGGCRAGDKEHKRTNEFALWSWFVNIESNQQISPMTVVQGLPCVTSNPSHNSFTHFYVHRMGHGYSPISRYKEHSLYLHVSNTLIGSIAPLIAAMEIVCAIRSDNHNHTPPGKSVSIQHRIDTLYQRLLK